MILSSYCPSLVDQRVEAPHEAETERPKGYHSNSNSVSLDEAWRISSRVELCVISIALVISTVGASIETWLNLREQRRWRDFDSQNWTLCRRCFLSWLGALLLLFAFRIAVCETATKRAGDRSHNTCQMPRGNIQHSVHRCRHLKLACHNHKLRLCRRAHSTVHVVVGDPK